MKILLTGGKGFVASAVEKSLITDGHTVLNVSRSTSPKLKEVLASSQQFDFYIHTAALSKDSPLQILKIIKYQMWISQRNY